MFHSNVSPQDTATLVKNCYFLTLILFNAYALGVSFLVTKYGAFLVQTIS